MAHLIAQQTRQDLGSRLSSKLAITRRLYDKGYKRESIINLYLFIDWVMRLPKELEEKFKTEIDQFERDSKMRYVSSIERLAKEEGIQKGLQKGVVQGQEEMRKPLFESLKLNLEFKFGKRGLDLLPVISRLKSAKELSVFQERLKAAQTASELKKLYK